MVSISDASRMGFPLEYLDAGVALSPDASTLAQP
jgi:hypothetical protein